MDIVLFRASPPKACDVAIVSATQTRDSTLLAASSPGGCSTAYEAVKHATYSALCREADLQLVPLVFDTFGALGQSSFPLLREIAHGISSRFNTSFAVTLSSLLAELNATLLRGLAQIILLGNERCIAE